MKDLEEIIINRHGHIFKESQNDRRWYWMYSKRITGNTESTVHGPYISQTKALKAMKNAWLNFLAKKWKVEERMKALKNAKHF